MEGFTRLDQDERILRATEGACRFYPDPKRLAENLADELTECIRSTISSRGVCHMVFPGGNSPNLVLNELREKKEIPWSRLHLYPSDERCVPLGDRERNDRLIDDLFFNYVSLPPENLHRIPAELGAEEGALRYSSLLNRTPRFDIVLLGMGPDGHTASLFPNHPAVYDRRQAVPVLNAPKPPPSRVSVSLKRLSDAMTRHIIVFGPDKFDIISSLASLKETPAMLVRPTVWHIYKGKD